MPDPTVPDRERLDLRADCSRCFALCCVALPFARSNDFAFTKAAGDPCVNLQGDFRCGIHTTLREKGFPGCTVYECFGAGQKVAQVTFHGTDWRAEPGSARLVFDVFATMRHLHELLWYLTEALDLHPSGPLAAQLRAALDATERLTLAEPETIAGVDVAAHRADVNTLLLAASEAAREPVVRARSTRLPKRVGRGADLLGARMPGADLSGANLRGAVLVAADLSRATLYRADLVGADLRDTDLRGADLSGALFLTQMQVQAARGDASTRIPAALDRPAHWAGAGSGTGAARPNSTR